MERVYCDGANKYFFFIFIKQYIGHLMNRKKLFIIIIISIVIKI